MASTNLHSQDWNEYWQQRADQSNSDSDTGVGIEHTESLVAFWDAVFRDHAQGPILELCCGSGVLSDTALRAGKSDLFALDISPAAAGIARKRIPDLHALVASADRIPLATGSMALVVSQFGVEYSNRQQAAAEIQRVLASGGQFRAIAHMHSSEIEAECQAHLADVDAIQSAGYLKAASDFLTSVHAFEKAPSTTARADLDGMFQAFAQVRDGLKSVILSNQIAARMHHHVNYLYQHRRRYSEQDIIADVNEWRGRLDAYAGRMRSMLGAAMNEADAKAFLASLSGKWSLETVRSDDRIIGWDLSARIA